MLPGFRIEDQQAGIAELVIDSLHWALGDQAVACHQCHRMGDTGAIVFSSTGQPEQDHFFGLCEPAPIPDGS